MIAEKDGKLFGKVNFEKGKMLKLTFDNTTLQRCDIEEQLKKFKDTGSMEIVNHGYTFRVEKEDTKYNLSLSVPVIKRAILNENEIDKLEGMLKEVMEKCSNSSFNNSHSATNLLTNDPVEF
jgi:hypothetical protein